MYKRSSYIISGNPRIGDLGVFMKWILYFIVLPLNKVSFVSFLLYPEVLLMFRICFLINLILSVKHNLANNSNIRKRCEICSELTMETPERCQWGHGVKVGPGPLDPGPQNPGTRNPPQSLDVGPGNPLNFKSGSPGPPSKFNSGTLIVIFLHCLTYCSRQMYI